MIFAIIRRILCGTNVLLELNIPTIIELFPQCKNEAELKYKKDETVADITVSEVITEKITEAVTEKATQPVTEKVTEEHIEETTKTSNYNISNRLS